MRSLGRFLQILGLFILPLAMVLELTGALGRESRLADLLVAVVFGFAIFYTGRFVEGYAGR